MDPLGYHTWLVMRMGNKEFKMNLLVESTDWQLQNPKKTVESRD